MNIYEEGTLNFWIWDGQTNERTAEVLYTPIFFLADVYKSYQKLTFRNLKKIYISCKSTFFPFDPFSYKKPPQITPPPVLIKFDTEGGI